MGKYNGEVVRGNEARKSSEKKVNEEVKIEIRWGIR